MTCLVGWEQLRPLIEGATAFIGLAAAIVAFIAVRKWREEVVWRRQFEIADDVLTVFYALRDAIPRFRDKELSGFITLDSIVEKGVRLQVLRHPFEIHFGKTAPATFDKLLRIIADINIAAARLLEAKSSEIPKTRTQREEHILQHQESIRWKSGPDPDPISRRLDEVIEEIEQLCLPVLRGGKRRH